jgi:phage baseplate assembly protein W
MAVIIGRTLVQDTKLFQDYAFGITLPIQIGKNAFNQSFTVIEQVESNIKNLLLTKKGERVLQPEFGSNLHKLLFDFNNEQMASDIEDDIVNTIAAWIPYVDVDDIIVEQTNQLKDLNAVYVSIRFKLKNTKDFKITSFTVQG